MGWWICWLMLIDSFYALEYNVVSRFSDCLFRWISGPSLLYGIGCFFSTLVIAIP